MDFHWAEILLTIIVVLGAVMFAHEIFCQLYKIAQI